VDTQLEPANGQATVLPPDPPPLEEFQLYDADARQSIPATLECDGELFPVILTAEPLTDKVLTDYAKKCEAASEGHGSDDAVAVQVRTNLDGLSWLFNQVMSDIEGVGEEGEERPEDWRDIFSAREKAAVIDASLFAVEVLELPPSTSKRPSWHGQLKNVTTKLRTYFNGQQVVTSHVLRKEDAQTYADFTALISRAVTSVRIVENHMLKLAGWYDALHVSHEGYVGRVPTFHKALVAWSHLSRQASVLRKNVTRSPGMSAAGLTKGTGRARSGRKRRK
jgi:hypothetical protein